MQPASIRLFPDPVLRAKAQKVTAFDEALRRLFHTMDLTMKSQPHGIGIAAPQIGVSLRVAIVDVSSRVPDAKRLHLVNPEIIQGNEERVSREGCMSLPDYTADLRRYDSIELRWQDESGRHRNGFFKGIEAVCIQHEVDHLNGILFLDRVICLKTDMYPRSARPKRGKS